MLAVVLFGVGTRMFSHPWVSCARPLFALLPCTPTPHPPLCRLLDDNRELFVPELQEVVRPHPHFMLFATQNPPGLYAGRKALSRAFR